LTSHVYMCYAWPMEKKEHIHIRATGLDKARLNSLDLRLPGVTQTDIVRAALTRLFKETEDMTEPELYQIVSDAIRVPIHDD